MRNFCTGNFLYHFYSKIKKTILRTAIVCVLLAVVEFAAAQSRGIETVILATPLTGTVDVPGTSIRLESGQLTTADYTTLIVQSTQLSKSIKNIISFQIKEETSRFISQNFSATAVVKIEYGHNSSSLNETEQTFVVTYDKAEGTKFNAKKYFSLTGAEYLKITLVSITAPTIGSLDTRDVLLLKNEMRITRYFELNTTVPPPSSFGYTTPADPVPDHLTVNWQWPANTTTSTGNNGTQIEWTWIENELEDNYKTNGTIDNNLVFKNATRVDLPYDKNNYDIPLLYDGQGKLYYRIRAVNIKEPGGRSDGPWNVANPFAFAGHNNDLNWQSNTSFAEEGKRKSVIQYYDGSLRGRQTVTKDNSTNTVVVAESFYDQQGRPAIQILPAPGISSVIKYQAGLNMFNTQLPDQDPADLFDMQPIATPNSLTEPLSIASGTSNYYSTSNIFATDGINKNIPDAEGYPYTVTRFTPDATGRILSQSGVGAAHKMGSTHETKYFYGSAAQEELDGLFGTEVGNFSHYSKNMVKDANGQMSISYTDMHGRTIATALAGDAPVCVDPLDKNNPANYPGQAGTIITRNLLDNSTNIVKDNVIESINSVLVPATTNYSFSYSLAPQALQLQNCPGNSPSNLCYECKYDLEIAIIDESGDPDVPVMLKKYTNIDLNGSPLSDDCGMPQSPIVVVQGNDALPGDISGYTISFVKQLPAGSFAIRKTLTVNEASYQTYLDLYTPKALCKTEQQIIDSIYQVLLSTSNCDTIPETCESCSTALGTFNQFRINYLLEMGIDLNDPNHPPVSAELDVEVEAAYAARQEDCNQLCTTISQSLPTIRQMMLQDMIPYAGQYAVQTANQHTSETVTTQAMYDKYNIFATTIPNVQPYFKFPWDEVMEDDSYRDENGVRDVFIHPEPEIIPVDPANNTKLNALTPAEFEDIFSSSWANALLPHHPEYARLKFAEDNLTASYNWITNFMQTESWQDAQTAGYLDPLANDPFFAAAPGSLTTVQNEMANYQGSNLSFWQLAYGDVKCKSILNQTARNACYSDQAHNTPIPFAGFTNAENDQAWKIFQAFYGALRNRNVDLYIATERPLPGTDEDQLVAEKYRLWFPRDELQQANQSGGGWWPIPVVPPVYDPIPSNWPTQTTTQTYTSRCDSYINMWRNRLLQCDALDQHANKETILTAITTRMKAVCINGSNAANPFGSSTVAPTTPGNITDRSFEQVIKEVFIQYGIINGNGIYTQNYCNPFVVEWPKPYGKGPQMSGGEQTTQLDSCNCTQYRTVKAQAVAQNVNVNSLTAFNLYLLEYHGDTLTQIMFDALRTKCADPSPACTCKDLNTVIDLYHVQYPNGGLDSCGTNPTDLGINLRTGNTPAEYVATNSISFGPSFESGVKDTFIDNIDTNGDCDSVAMCRIRFINFFNAHYNYNPPLTWNQIDSIYIANCGHSPYVCGYKDYNYSELARVICNFRNHEVVLFFGENTNGLLGDCQVNFTNFFNNYYHNIPPLTYQQIEAIYAPYAGPSSYSLNLYTAICGTAIPAYCGDSIPPVNCTDSLPYIFPYPVPLPAFLKCGYEPNPRCVSCAGLSTLTGEYKTLFNAPVNTAPVFTGSNLTPDQVEYNMNFARFLNYRLGYRFNWLDYSQAAVAALPTCDLNNYPNNGGALQNVICGDPYPLDDTTGYLPADTPCHRLYTMAINIGQNIYRIRLQQQLAAFEAAYKGQCLAVKNTEQFTMQYLTSEYHYTLYYYDQAGNLVKTVPPKGVRPDFSSIYTNQVKADRGAGIDNPRPHEFITQYRYSSLNQVVAQQTPDAGISRFWYDALGRLVVSQNAQQFINNKFSYTLYDNLGRIQEVGQKPQTSGSMSQTISQDAVALANWINTNGGTKEQMTRTTYDLKAVIVNPVPLDQQNLRNRISYVQVFDTDPGSGAPFDHHTATYYTYDIHGNVDILLQDYKGIPEMTINPAGNRFKTTQYNYDLVSGKVNMVTYQPDYYDVNAQIWIKPSDQFNHRYEYDSENRLTQVFTSRDKLLWERDAKYDYYKHGPLARTELGQLGVQGTDYAYTIQGWLKGVNNSSLNPNTDIFSDGSSVSTVAKDILAFGLHYYNESVNGNDYIDFKPIGDVGFVPYRPFANIPSSMGGATGGLYNGNIRAMSVKNAGLFNADAGSNNTMPLFYSYRYDQLNRITAMQTYKGLDSASNEWTPIAIDDYKEAITYDPNGNIKTYNRKGAPTAGMPNQMDDLTYDYIASTNRLKSVFDNVPGGNYPSDIDHQMTYPNYTYDAIGNLIADAAEGIDAITWNVYGKIKSIHKTNGDLIEYTYDAGGNRISKKVPGEKGSKTTIYVRDASGNVMGIYEGNGETLEQTEVHVYGSSRLGVLNKITEPTTSITLDGAFGTAKLSTFTRGEKLFELSNHLGNVLATISDKKIAIDANTDGTIDHYNADVITANDYYPFGMGMPGRNFRSASSSYRYGFNGKENDNEVKGEGNQQDYGMRIYDPRLGKFLSVDPLSKSYPMLTPFQYASNNPIQNVDIDGLEGGAANGARTNTEAPSGPWELGFLKAEKETYNNSAWLGTPGTKLKIPIFTRNAVRSAYNQAITSVEDLPTNFRIINNVFSKDGRAENRDRAFVGFINLINWWSNDPWKEVGFYEDIAGGLILGAGVTKSNPFARGNSYLNLISKDKVRVTIANAEELRYLKSQGKQGDYNPYGSATGDILLAERSRIILIEEAIHYKQKKTHGIAYCEKNLNQLEFDAQMELLRIGKQEGWSTEKMTEIKNAAQIWGKKAIQDIDNKISELNK